MKFTKVAAFFMAAMFMFGAAGCSSPAGNAADTEAVMTAMDKFSACKSFTVVQTTEREETVTIEKETQEYVGATVVETGIIISPVPQMYSSTTASLGYDGEVLEQSIISYLIPENGGYTEYYSDGTEWFKYSVADSHALDGLGTGAVTSTFTADKLSYSKAGEETLESGKAIRYEGTLGGEDLVAMLESYGHLGSIAEMSENMQAQIKANLVKDLDDVTVSVWVDEASGYPVRFAVDLTDILKDFEKSVAKSLGNKVQSDWVITKYAISMTVKDFDAVEEFKLPAEALSAKPYEA